MLHLHKACYLNVLECSCTLQSGLCDFAVAGSEVTIISSERPPEFAESTSLEVEGRSLHWIAGGLLDREAYLKAGVATAHAVILGSVQVQWGGVGCGWPTTVTASS